MKKFRSAAPPAVVVQKVVDLPVCADVATPTFVDLKNLMANVVDLQAEVAARVSRRCSDEISTLMDRLAPRLDELSVLTVGMVDSV